MDFDIGNLLDMAGNVSGTINDAVSAFGEVTKLAKGGKLPADAAENVLALSGQLGEAQVTLARLEAEIVKLQGAQEALDEIKQRKRNYMLAETPMGARIYRLKEDAGTGEPPHEVCPTCFEQDQIRILQPRGIVLQCDSCKANYQVERDSGPAVALGHDYDPFSGF